MIHNFYAEKKQGRKKKSFLFFIDAFYTRFSAFSEQFIALKSRKYAAQWELFDFSDIKTNWMKNTTLFYEFIFLFFGFNLRYELMERIFRLHNAEFVGHAARFSGHSCYLTAIWVVTLWGSEVQTGVCQHARVLRGSVLLFFSFIFMCVCLCPLCPSCLLRPSSCHPRPDRMTRPSVVMKRHWQITVCSS